MTSVRPQLVIASTFTAEPVRDVLDFWDRVFGWGQETSFAPYNQVFQNLLDPGSPLGQNAGGVNVLLLRWDDLLWRDGGADLERVVEDLVGALRESAGRSRAPHVVVFTRAGGSGVLVPEVVAQLGEVERRIRGELAELAGVHVIDSAWLDRVYPVADWRDADGEHVGHVPYTAEYFAAIGTAVSRRLSSLRRKPYKVVVLDCDNTLWGGVVGEDGAEGVRLDEPFRRLQQFMLDQASAGRILCLCSKNREEDVRQVFAVRQDMPLSWNDIIAHRINWDSKVANIQSLAEELDLGLDSFVFVDDNAVECAAVRSALPEVLTVQVPSDADNIAHFLDHVWGFDILRVTDDDRRRGEMYREGAMRNQARREAPSLDAFLASLDLRIDIATVGASDVSRAAQLTQRTNQFNATGVVRSEQEVKALLAVGGQVATRVAVSDRFGDYGTVGLAIGAAADDVLQVDTFLLSCRALGRGVEHAMLADLGKRAVELGCGTIRVAFRRTDRNEPAERFVREVGALEGASFTESGVDVPASVAASARYVSGRAEPEARPVARTEAAADRVSGGASDVLHVIPVDFSRACDVLAAVRTQVRVRPELQQTYVEPRRGLEQSIAQIWRDVLRIDRAGALDRFSDLGGASLHLVRVHGRLRTELGVSVELTSLFQHATIRALAEHMAALTQNADASRGMSTRARAERQRAALAAAGMRHGRRND